MTAGLGLPGICALRVASKIRRCRRCPQIGRRRAVRPLASAGPPPPPPPPFSDPDPANLFRMCAAWPRRAAQASSRGPRCRMPGRTSLSSRDVVRRRGPPPASRSRWCGICGLAAALAAPTLTAPLEADQAFGAEARLAEAGWRRGRGIARRPHSLHAERGGRADNRGHVERLGHRIEKQGEPGVGASPPLPVQPLDVCRTQLPRRGIWPPDRPGRARRQEPAHPRREMLAAPGGGSAAVHRVTSPGSASLRGSRSGSVIRSTR